MNSHQSPTYKRSIPVGLLGLIGLALGTLAIAYLLNHPDPSAVWNAELAVAGLVSIGVIATARWLITSAYDVSDLWAIFGWSIIGAASAIVLAGGLYLHQSVEQATLADPTFLFEELALIGLAAGLAFGLNRRSRFERQLEATFDEEAFGNSDELWTILPLLGENTDELHQRWTILSALASTNTQEIPAEAFITQLASASVDSFPDDRAAVRTLLEQEHIPVLVENGLITVDNDINTVKYAGPKPVAEYLTAEQCSVPISGS